MSDDLLTVIKTYDREQLIEYIVAQHEMWDYLHKKKSDLEETCKTLIDIEQMSSQREYIKISNDIISTKDGIYKKVKLEDIQ